MNAVLAQRPARLPLARACHVLGLNRSTVYTRQKRAANDEQPRRSRKQSVQPRALSNRERAVVVEMLHSQPYCDQPPAEVYQRLLEQDQYLCSVSTTENLSSEDQSSAFLPSPGTINPFNLASFRQVYRVQSEIPVSSTSRGIGVLSGGIILLMTACFLSSE